MFSSNLAATSIARFEGRTWVLDKDNFFAATRFLDSDYNTMYQGKTKENFEHDLQQHTRHQVCIIISAPVPLLR
jgi:hypothetical protein